MDLSRLRNVYAHEGPFVTVYLEGRGPSEDAREQMRLRWKALSDHLSSERADADAVTAVESALVTDKAGEEMADGRVLVADASGVVLDEQWDAALGTGDFAHWTRLPELGAFVRERARSVRMLVAITDQESARVRQEVIAQEHSPRALNDEEVEGSANSGVHKPRGGWLSHNQIQRRADHAVERNVEDIVAHLRTVSAHFRPDVLVLAGETQARTAVRDELPEALHKIVVDAERGGTRDETSEQALADELREIAGNHSARTAESRAEQLDSGLAHGRAVQGDEAVMAAAEQGAVDTLLFEHDHEAAREALLIKTCAETGAGVDLVSTGTGLTDGVGALLRHPVST